MERKHIFSIVGGLISLAGVVMSGAGGASKPINFALVIPGMIIAFVGRLISVYGDEWF